MQDGAVPTIRESVDGPRMSRRRFGIWLTNDNAKASVSSSGLRERCGAGLWLDKGASRSAPKPPALSAPRLLAQGRPLGRRG